MNLPQIKPGAIATDANGEPFYKRQAPRITAKDVARYGSYDAARDALTNGRWWK